MTLKKLTKDSFFLGLTGGAIMLYVFYLIVSQIRLFIVTGMNDPHLFGSPRSELIAVTLNLICFRFLLLTFHREKTAKGVLFTTVVSTFVYFFYFYKMRN